VLGFPTAEGACAFTDAGVNEVPTKRTRNRLTCSVRRPEYSPDSIVILLRVESHPTLTFGNVCRAKDSAKKVKKSTECVS